MQIHFDVDTQTTKLYVEAPKVLETLKTREKENDWHSSLRCDKRLFLDKTRRVRLTSCTDLCSFPNVFGFQTFLRGSEWHPEFGNHMIEATPSPPYLLNVNGLLDIEESMLSRRLKLQVCNTPAV